MTADPFAAKLILTIGLPGSGKSTWAREYAVQRPPAIIVERDAARYLLTGDVRDHSQEPAVSAYCREQVIEGLCSGLTVLVSDTNLKPRYRNEWMGLAGRCGASVEIKSFLHVPLETCIERDAARPNPVGEDVIRKMHKYLLDSGQLPH